MSLDFIKAGANFCLKSDKTNADFKFKITSMKLQLKKIKIYSSYKLELEQRLANEAAIYPLRHASVKPFFLDAKEKSSTFENIFQSRSIPSYCAVAIVTQEAYRGTQGTSPFDFAHHSLSSLKITIDGEVFPSISPFTPNYDSETAPDWTQEYLALQDYQMKVDAGTLISYDLFKKHFAFYIFHMGRESSLANDHTSPKRAGSARLDVAFAASSNNPALTLLLYTESDEILTIDHNRNVNRDYHL